MDLLISAGVFPLATSLVGAGLLLLLLLGRTRRWWLRRVPIAVAGGLAATAGVTLFANHVWHPFPDPLPSVVVVWLGMALVGACLAVARTAPALNRVAGVGAALLIAVCGGVEVNASFGTYPTLAAAFGEPLPDEVASQVVIGRTVPVAAVAADQPLVGSWTPTGALPAAGEVITSSIPGLASGFAAGDAWIYLPPAYQADPRPMLPVLILLSGQPGEPRNWFDGSNVAGTMDAYAAAHSGVAPVVVVPDWIGSVSGNPLCVDSAAGGNDFSYLSVDVPNWIRANLQVDGRPSRWAVGGLSAGATCAVQLAANAPQQFPTFLDFSGQQEPTLSNRADTVAALFGGSEAAFEKVNPLDVFRTHSFAGSAGMFMAGAQDADYGPQTQTMFRAAQAAGVDATFRELPGGHNSPFWAAALASSMDWLGGHLGLTAEVRPAG